MRPRRRTILMLGAAALVVGVAGFVVGKAYFFPESATRVNESFAAGEARVEKSGTFSGRAGHHVSGAVQVVESGGEYFLRFESYEQTQGPDVFVYLTPSEDPDTDAEIQGGLRVLIDGGADGGESTKVGNFQQRLPPAFDPLRYGGVAIWCDRFNVPFGAATLTPP